MKNLFEFLAKKGVNVFTDSNKFEFAEQKIRNDVDPLFRSNHEYIELYSQIASNFENHEKMLISLVINTNLHVFWIDDSKSKHFCANGICDFDANFACWIIVDAFRRNKFDLKRHDIETLKIESSKLSDDDFSALLYFFASARALGRARAFGLAQLKRSPSVFLRKLINSPDTIFKTSKKKK